MTADERNKIEALAELVATMDKKLDLVVERQSVSMITTADHEKRMRSLEKWKYGVPVTGILAGLSLVAAHWLH